MSDFYAAIENDIDDITLGLRVLDAKAREIRGAFDARQTLTLHRATNDLVRLTEQLEALSDGLAAKAHARLRAQ
jgi:hypothetical protein